MEAEALQEKAKKAIQPRRFFTTFVSNRLAGIKLPKSLKILQPFVWSEDKMGVIER